MTNPISQEMDARRGHDVADFCDRIWAIAFGTVAGREPSPRGLGPPGDHQLSQERDGRDSDPTKTGIFRDHRCWKCDDGDKPCVRGTPNRCEYPHARND